MAINPYIAVPAGLGAGALALSNSTGVASSINAFSALATGIATGTTTLVSNILGATGAAKIGAMAPLAAPFIGGMLGYKVAGWLGAESEIGKLAGAGLGLGAGAGALVGTGALAGSFAPLLLGAGGIYAGYKTLGWTWGKIRRKSA